MIDNPVFLCGASRSGTTLLSNLLDWNEKYFILPNETSILMQFYRLKQSYWNTYFTREYLTHHDIAFYIDDIYRNFFNSYLANQYGKQAAWKLPLLNRELFIMTYLDSLPPSGISSPKYVYIALWQALMKTCSEHFDLPGTTSFGEKMPFCNEMSALDLAKMFPNAKFIHIVRDPRTRYISAKKRHIRTFLGFYFCKKYHGIDFPTVHALASACSFMMADINREVLKNKYLIIRYEDLIHDRLSIMKIVANFLDIEFTQNLTTQTRLGKPAGANSSFKKNIKKNDYSIYEKRLKEFEKGTSYLERMILYIYCHDRAKTFGYDLPKCDINKKKILHKIFGFIKHEYPLDYFSNRKKYFKKFILENPFLTPREDLFEILEIWHQKGIYYLD